MKSTYLYILVYMNQFHVCIKGTKIRFLDIRLNIFIDAEIIYENSTILY